MPLPQIFYIHGGMTFSSRAAYVDFLRTIELRCEDTLRWSDTIIKDLDGVYEVIKPRMPIKENARYEEWKLYFEKFFPHLRDDIVLIGNSLGGIFLARYLSENTLPVRIAATILVCPPFDNSLSTEELVGGFELGEDLSNITKQSANTLLYFSANDDVVEISHAEKYRRKLPDATVTIFPDKNGHFQVETFPELLEELRNLANAIK